MKTILRLPNIIWLCIGLFAFVAACKQPEPTPPAPAAPTITSINPATATVGSSVTITGTNFSTTPGSNTVTFNGVSATVVSPSTPTQLIVIVPNGAQNGPVAVNVGGVTVTAATSFTIAPPPPSPLKPVVVLQGDVRLNRTLSRDTIYLLRGFVYVPANFTMTIQPGTVIKGAGPEQDPSGTNRPGTLIVDRVGRLIANGTATQPIVFTSNKAVGQRASGDWGGIVLIGKSPTNRPGNTVYFAGIRGTAETYNEPEDNSGSLQYVRIEYAGTGQRNVDNNQLGGLTLIGVGNGTTIRNVQVSHSSGDGFAWYGGSVNASNLIAYRAADDNWSTTWGYYGNVQFGVGLRDVAVSDASGSNGFESQNYDPGENANGAPLTRQNGLPQTVPTFANMSEFAYSTVPSAASATSVGAGFYQSGVYLWRNTGFRLYNSVIAGYPEGVRFNATPASISSLTAATGLIDLRGNTFANTLTSGAGRGLVNDAIVTQYLTTASFSNQVIPSNSVATLLLNGSTFNLQAPVFTPQTGSPLLSGAVTLPTIPNVTTQPFTSVQYRGAFGTTDWTSGWTNYNPQATDYDR